MSDDGFYDVIPRGFKEVEVECGTDDDSSGFIIYDVPAHDGGGGFAGRPLSNKEYQQRRPFQEDGHLAADAYDEEHDA